LTVIEINLNKFECMAMCRVGQPSKHRKVLKPDVRVNGTRRDNFLSFPREGPKKTLQFEWGVTKAPIRHFSQAVENYWHVLYNYVSTVLWFLAIQNLRIRKLQFTVSKPVLNRTLQVFELSEPHHKPDLC